MYSQFGNEGYTAIYLHISRHALVANLYPVSVTFAYTHTRSEQQQTTARGYPRTQRQYPRQDEKCWVIRVCFSSLAHGATTYARIAIGYWKIKLNRIVRAAGLSHVYSVRASERRYIRTHACVRIKRRRQAGGERERKRENRAQSISRNKDWLSSNMKI